VVVLPVRLVVAFECLAQADGHCSRVVDNVERVGPVPELHSLLRGLVLQEAALGWLKRVMRWATLPVLTQALGARKKIRLL